MISILFRLGDDGRTARLNVLPYSLPAIITNFVSGTSAICDELDKFAAVKVIGKQVSDEYFGPSVVIKFRVRQSETAASLVEIVTDALGAALGCDIHISNGDHVRETTVGESF